MRGRLDGFSLFNGVGAASPISRFNSWKSGKVCVSRRFNHNGGESGRRGKAGVLPAPGSMDQGYTVPSTAPGKRCFYFSFTLHVLCMLVVFFFNYVHVFSLRFVVYDYKRGYARQIPSRSSPNLLGGVTWATEEAFRFCRRSVQR